jgi:aspartate aminotransferase
MLSKIATNQAKSSFIATRSSNFSVWEKVTAAPPDPILGLNEAFKKETNPKKVLLGMGAYRDDAGKPYILSCVKKASQIINDKNMDHEYAPIQGIDSYVDKVVKLAYGEDSQHYKDGNIAGAQSISGTGSIRLGLDFLAEHYPKKGATVYIPD